MKKRLPIALLLAALLALILTPLALAQQPAFVRFTTDAPCPVTVLVTSYTNTAGQPGQTAGGSTTWTLETAPATSVTFFYPATVTCGGTTYNFVSASPSSPVMSGAEASTTEVMGHYESPIPADTTPPVWTVPADFSVEATGPSGAVVTYAASASDPSGVSFQECLPASGATFALGTTTVNCTATDTVGNTGSTSFNVTVVDTTPPALNLPSNMAVTAWNAQGAVVNYAASASDLVDGPVAVNCSPASGALFPIGQTTVNCSAADSRGNTASGGFTVSVQYAAFGTMCKGVPGHQILQPINMDGSSVFKAGSTVPARFRVCGADGVPIGDPGVVTNFRLVQIISDGVVTNVDQEVLSTPPHAVFRSGNQQWIFDISTKNLAAGGTYVFVIVLNDGSTIPFQFSLK